MFSIPLIKPYLPPGTKERVNAVLDSGVLTEGPVTRELEAVAAGFIGCRHALAVTSCTTGLEVALRALGIGPGDEVIVPDYTYPATAEAVAIVGACSGMPTVAPAWPTVVRPVRIGSSPVMKFARPAVQLASA